MPITTIEHGNGTLISTSVTPGGSRLRTTVASADPWQFEERDAERARRLLPIAQGIAMEWATDSGLLRACHPTREELVAVAPAVTQWLNAPPGRNAKNLGIQPNQTVEDTKTFLLQKWHDGIDRMLLFVDGMLVGYMFFGDWHGPGPIALLCRGQSEPQPTNDWADIPPSGAEFGALIGDPRVQGKGLGTRFAVMVHKYAIEQLGLDRFVAAAYPWATGSRRLLAKLGYERVLDAPTVHRWTDEYVPHLARACAVPQRQPFA